MDGLAKMLGFDKVAETKKTLIAKGSDFSKELNCPVSEIRLMIAYTEKGNPYGILFHSVPGKEPVRIRDVKIEEIVK